MAVNRPVTLEVKRGDDFTYELTVTDLSSNEALEAQDAVDAAQLIYDTALEADPQIPEDIADALAALNIEKAAYVLAIIVDITGWTIAAKLAWIGKHVSDFEVEITNASLGQFKIIADSDVTSLWKPRIYEADIEFNHSSFGKQSSDTFYIKVERDITNG